MLQTRAPVVLRCLLFSFLFSLVACHFEQSANQFRWRGSATAAVRRSSDPRTAAVRRQPPQSAPLLPESSSAPVVVRGAPRLRDPEPRTIVMWVVAADPAFKDSTVQGPIQAEYAGFIEGHSCALTWASRSPSPESSS